MTAFIRAKHIRIGMLLLMAVPLLAGCWDRQEIEERAIVLGIGVDVASPNEEKANDQTAHKDDRQQPPTDGMVRLTAQIAVPGRIPLGPGDLGGGGGGQKTVWVVEIVGHTVDEAIANLQQKVASPLFFGHLRVIIISEALAKRGIENLDEYFRRNSEVRRMNWMFVCRGSAKDYMRIDPELERVPTVYLLTAIDQAVKNGRFPNDFVGIYWSASSAKGKEGYLPYIERRGNDTIQINGLAYFISDKLVGVTDPADITLFMGIVGLNPGGGQAYVQIPGTSNFAMFGTRSRSSKIHVYMADGKPHIKVNVEIEGNLVEKSSDQFTLTPELIEDMEKALVKLAKGAYDNLVKKTQEKGSDIFGFGEYVRAKKSRYWNKEIKTKEMWQQAYKNLPVEVDVKVNIRRVGMRSN